jgi:hypothetical protein
MKKYIMTIGNYKNKVEMIISEKVIFIHEGNLLHKTNLEMNEEI